MWETAIYKLGLISLLFLNYSCPILTQDLGLISKSKWNSPEHSNANDQSKRDTVNGENLIVAEEISCWEKNGHWEKLQVCPNSTIVTGHRFRYLVRTGLTGIELKCTQKYEKNETGSEHILQMNFDHKVEKDLPRGKWGIWKNKSRSVFAEGFSFNRGELTLGRTVQNYNIIYHSGNAPKILKQSTVNSNSGKMYTKCPEDHAICGLTAMMDKAQLGILTSIGLKCCHHCVPMETWLTVYEYNNTGDVEEEKKVQTTVGLQRIPQNEQLELSSIVTNLRKTFAAKFGKFNSTDFDWTRTLDAIWSLDETTITKTHISQAHSSFALKQLVGQCGSVRVPVDKVCGVTVPIGSSIPDSCKAVLDSRSFSNCRDDMKIVPSAKQRIYPHGNQVNRSLEVLCDFETDGGGWTTIQKRTSGPKHEFNQNWTEYSNGFGALDKNFWIGLENIHALTQNGDQELRIQLEDFEGEKRWAKYSSFSVSSASDFYRLSIDGYDGNSTAGNDMVHFISIWALDGMQFSTPDKDNDKYHDGSCGQQFGSGWWFNKCFAANLNGLYFDKGETVPFGHGIIWQSWKGFDYFLAKTEMKIRTRK